jgi:membrane-bound lytic murein transglycosylase D
MTNLNDDLVLHYQQWYQNRPDAMRRMVERSRPYLHHIVQELEARGMPTEIALLPMVESSFNPMAYSRSHASGLWQFIPATGKRFNLEQNWWQDQRRDIVASTSAALEYLQTIYEMHGDWHLALASYNWGEGAVKRAIEKNTARGLATDYSSLTMPSETRHYVPKLQALKNIFGNAALMAQLGLPEIINRPYFATVETSRPMDVKTAARLANMRVDEFVALNPSHNRPVMKAETPVVLPAEKVATFQNNLENHDAPLTEWEAYTLKPGEKLDQLAPRFGIPLADLLHANGLQAKVRLGSGATLLVPAGNGSEGLDVIGNEPRLPQIVDPEPVARAPAAPAPTARAGKAGKTAVVAGKGERVHLTIAAKSAGKPATKAATGKETTKVAVAAKPAAQSVKTAAGKPATTATATKVARSGNGRRS